NRMVRLVEISDGTANTILVTECAGRPRQWRVGRPGPDQTVGGCPWTGHANSLTVRGSAPDGVTRPGPCAVNCTNLEVYSFHPAGANAVFADGSVVSQFAFSAPQIRGRTAQTETLQTARCGS